MTEQANSELRATAPACGPHGRSLPPGSRYERHFDVVSGSLDCPLDDLVVGDWEAGPTCGGASVPMNLRFSGDVVFLDRGTQPRVALKGGRLRDWVMAQRSIEPVCIRRADLRLTGGAGWRIAVVPRGCGGGIVYERPDAFRDRRTNSAQSVLRRLTHRWWHGS
jgi:hypothetical protein